MSELTIFDFNTNNIRFESRSGRVWVSLTDRATAANKKVNDWGRLKSTQEFLTELETVTGIPVTETIQGGQPSLQGTWALKEVAIEYNCSEKAFSWRKLKTASIVMKQEIKQVPCPRFQVKKPVQS